MLFSIWMIPFVGRAETSDCPAAFSTGYFTCNEVGFLITMNNIEGPTTLTSIPRYSVVDTLASKVYLLQKKMARIHQELP